MPGVETQSSLYQQLNMAILDTLFTGVPGMFM